MNGRVLVVAVAFLGVACTGKGVAQVDGVHLPQADRVQDSSNKGVIVTIPKDSPEPIAVPAEQHVRLAMHWGTPWHVAWTSIDTLNKAGKEVELLVGKRASVKRFTLTDTLEKERRIRVYATYTNGKACVRAPGSKEAKCVQSPDKKFLDRAGLRGTIREAVTKLNIQDVEIQVDPDLSWGDVVRVIDAARTCCFDETVRAALSESSYPKASGQK